MIAEATAPMTTPSGVINAILVVLILSSILTDLTHQKIYNLQTYPAMLSGLALGFLSGGWQGSLTSFVGLCLGMGLLLLFYLTGGVGGGDVKLLGAIGALKGASFVVWVMFYTALIGGVMALALIIWQGTLRQTLGSLWMYLRHPLKPPAGGNAQYLPYGIAISLGCLWGLAVL